MREIEYKLNGDVSVSAPVLSTVPPDYVREWPQAVRTVWQLLREHPKAQGIPSHVLDAMQDILLAAPRPTPAPNGLNLADEPREAAVDSAPSP